MAGELRAVEERPRAVLPDLQEHATSGATVCSDIPDESIFWRDHVVMWVKDYRRTLDYLEHARPTSTRRGSPTSATAGAETWAGIIPAVEPRIKAAVLYVAGLTMERGRPEVEPINYLPRIKSPVLMLNGKYDFFFPAETAQQAVLRACSARPRPTRSRSCTRAGTTCRARS